MKKQINNFLDSLCPKLKTTCFMKAEDKKYFDELDIKTENYTLYPEPVSVMTDEEKAVLTKLRTLAETKDTVLCDTYGDTFQIKLDSGDTISGSSCLVKMNDRILLNNVSNEARKELRSIMVILVTKACRQRQEKREQLLNNFLNL